MIGSGIVLFFCTFLLLIFVFLPLPVPPDSPALTIYIIRGTMQLFYGLPAAIELWWLILFNRKVVAIQFTGNAQQEAPGESIDARAPHSLPPTVRSPLSLPVPLIVVAVLMILSSFSILFLLWMPRPAFLFGQVIHGWEGSALYVGSCLLYTIGGVGLLKMRPGVTRSLWRFTRSGWSVARSAC
jgi:hypothetical protein